MPRPELSEKYFRRFERIIRTACEAYPQIAQVSASSVALQPLTLASRLRDAIRSLRLYKWMTDWQVNYVTLSKLCVSFDPRNEDHILIGPQELLTSRDFLSAAVSRYTGVANDAQAQPTDFVILQDPTPEIVEAYVILANARPVGLPRLWLRRTPLNTPVFSELLARLEAANDIAVIANDDHWIIL